MGGSTFGRLTRNLGIFARYPAAITQAGEAEKETNKCTPRGLGGDKTEVSFSLILISLLEMRSTRFEAKGFGGLNSTSPRGGCRFPGPRGRGAAASGGGPGKRQPLAVQGVVQCVPSTVFTDEQWELLVFSFSRPPDPPE